MRARTAELWGSSQDQALEAHSELTASESLRFEPTQQLFLAVRFIAVPSLMLAGTAPDQMASPAGFEPASPT
ncbi:MAG: hypothetical protein RL701_192 [Pseudomonadota bacterium]